MLPIRQRKENLYLPDSHFLNWWELPSCLKKQKYPFFQICLTPYVCRLYGGNTYPSSFKTQLFLQFTTFVNQIPIHITHFYSHVSHFPSTCSFLSVLCLNEWYHHPGNYVQVLLLSEHPLSSLTFSSINLVSQNHFVSNTNAIVWLKGPQYFAPESLLLKHFSFLTGVYYHLLKLIFHNFCKI